MAGKPKPNERIAAAFLACLFLAVVLAKAAAPEPKFAGDATVLADRKTGTGTGAILLRNDSGADLQVSLTLMVNTTKISQLAVRFSGKDSKANGEQLSLTIKKDQAEPVWITATNVWDSGDTPVDLLDKDTKIGTIKIRRLPFSVKLDGPSPEKAELSLQRYVETRIMLKNDDPVAYKLDWQLFVDGRVICDGQQAPVDPNGYGVLKCNSATIPFRFRHLLKDETLNGTLLLGDKGLVSPLKTFPVSASLYTFSQGARYTIRYLIVFLILVAGGLFSLFLNQSLPNQLQKLNLKEQLFALAKTTSDLSTQLDSKLGVLVRLERTRLTTLLNSRSTVFPEFATVATQVTDGLSKLTSRVKLLQQMDLIMGRLAKIAPHGSPPTLVDQVTDGLDKASVLLGKVDCSDADIQAAQSALGTASTLVDSLTNPGADFGQSLAQRIQATYTDISAIADKTSFLNLQKIVPGPWQNIQSAAQPNFKISPGLLESLDGDLCKLKLMREYTALVEGTHDAAMLHRLQGKMRDLAGYLQLGSLKALNSAQALLREMQEDIYPKRVREAVENHEAYIRLDSAVAYVGAPLTFALCFRNKGVNEATAREEWTCNWNFGDGLSATGWEASHYYDLKRLEDRRPAPDPKAATDPKTPKGVAAKVTVVATFQDEKGHDVTKSHDVNKPDSSGPNPDPITVSLDVTVYKSVVTKSWERTWAEGLKLGAALLIAVLGLAAGAGDQIAKLDVLPAVAAVFLLGFGADTIKNVFSPKPA
jgi:hypothetical protein